MNQGAAFGQRKDSEQEENAHEILTVLRETAESVLKPEGKRKSLEGRKCWGRQGCVVSLCSCIFQMYSVNQQ